MRHITEAEFRTYVERRRQELALEIAKSGLTIYQIAVGTRMKWQTVQRMAQGKSVRNESQDRVRCFLEVYQQSMKKHTKKHEKDTH